MAAVAPGTYKGSLHLTSGSKIPGSPATVTVAGNQGPGGKYDMLSAPIKYQFKGTLKANKVSGKYIPPLGGTGEYFTANSTFSPATKSFTGKLSFVGRCQAPRR